eukprot:3798116-Rhodomonas_salina.1
MAGIAWRKRMQMVNTPGRPPGSPPGSPAMPLSPPPEGGSLRRKKDGRYEDAEAGEDVDATDDKSRRRTTVLPVPETSVASALPHSGFESGNSTGCQPLYLGSTGA